MEAGGEVERSSPALTSVDTSTTKSSLNEHEQSQATTTSITRDQRVGTPSSSVIPLTPVARDILPSSLSATQMTRDCTTHDVSCDTTDFTLPSISPTDSSSDELDIVLRNNRVSE